MAGRLRTLGFRVKTAEPRIRVDPPPPQPGQAEGSRWGQGRGGRPWRRIRDRILKRDEYLCQACRREGLLTLAEEVDHIVPEHQGGTDDDSNLEAICKPHHDAKTQAEAHAARRGRNTTMRPSGLRPPSRPLSVVVGPPGSGKSTYVREHAGPADLVIDLDELALEILGTELWSLPPGGRAQVLTVRNDRLRAYCDGLTDYPAAWLIVGRPGDDHVRFWSRLGARVVRLDTDLETCRARVRARELPTAVVDDLVGVIDRWT